MWPGKWPTEQWSEIFSPSLDIFVAIVSATARYTLGADRYPHLGRRAPSRWITQIDRQSVRESAFSAGGGTQRAQCHAFAPTTLYMTIAMSLGRASRLSCCRRRHYNPVSLTRLSTLSIIDYSIKKKNILKYSSFYLHICKEKVFMYMSLRNSI